MPNCPKCQYPNEDESTVCAACGAPLEVQQAPAQPAMDPALMQQQMELMQQQMQQMQQMQQQAGGAPQQPVQAEPAAVAAQVPTQPVAAAPGQPAAPAMQLPPEMTAAAPMGAPMSPGQAQAEIDQWAAEQRARKRTKMLIYTAITLAIVGVLGFFWLQNMRKEKRVNEVHNFFTAFRGVDDEAVAGFWKCTVRAKHRDIRLAKDTMEVTDGLTKAFNNFPTSQPGHIKDKCVPLIAGILEDLDKLKPPTGFTTALDSVKEAMKAVRTTFVTYADKIDQRKGEAVNEQEVRNLANNFHMAHDNPDSAPKALEYYNLLKCAIPDLDPAIKAVKKPPNTQPVVEFIYNSCKEDPKYADKLRVECFEKRKELLDLKDKGFKDAVYNMAGDNRDTMALDHCFTESNKGFDYVELEAVAKVFIKYNNARGEILKALAKVKQEVAD